MYESSTSRLKARRLANAQLLALARPTPELHVLQYDQNRPTHRQHRGLMTQLTLLRLPSRNLPLLMTNRMQKRQLQRPTLLMYFHINSPSRRNIIRTPQSRPNHRHRHTHPVQPKRRFFSHTNRTLIRLIRLNLSYNLHLLSYLHRQHILPVP